MRSFLGVLVAVATLGLAFAGDKVDSQLARHYDEHRWTDLGVALEAGGGPALYRGAVGEVFNDPRAESQRWSVIRASPRDEAAFEAYEWLSHLAGVRHLDPGSLGLAFVVERRRQTLED